MFFFSGHAAPYPGGAQKTARGHMEEKQIIQQTHSEESNPGDMPRNTVIYLNIKCFGSGSRYFAKSGYGSGSRLLLNVDQIRILIRVHTKIF